MTDFSTRPARPQDAAALGAIAEAAGLFPAAAADEMMQPYFQKTTSDLWLVADVAGAVAGMCFAREEAFTAGTWNMLALGVQEDARGHGVGAGLVTQLCRSLRALPARLLIVETSSAAEFDCARAFYAAFGFQSEGRIRDYWDDGDDKVIARLRL